MNLWTCEGISDARDNTVEDVKAMMADLKGTINRKCGEDWPHDFSMQEFCRQQQWAAARQIGEIPERYKTRLNESLIYRIIGKCHMDWLPDVTMAAFCTKEQIEAAIRLKD